METKDSFQKNFFTVYKNTIEPKFENIDILLKTAEEAISIEETSVALSIPYEEVLMIMKKNYITIITKEDFLKIMEAGSSYICQLYRRELECGSPYIYTPWHIGYIYGIDVSDVDKACHALGIKEITQGVLPFIFSCIKA